LDLKYGERARAVSIVQRAMRKDTKKKEYEKGTPSEEITNFNAKRDLRVKVG